MEIPVSVVARGSVWLVPIHAGVGRLCTVNESVTQ